jgi:hypothetical protein
MSTEICPRNARARGCGAAGSAQDIGETEEAACCYRRAVACE